MKGAGMGYSVGKSSFGELAGVEQFVASADVSNQVASLCYEFDTTVAKNGDRLTVNEGIRSRPRQKMLRDAWDHYQRFGTPWASLAATIYNSTHDESRGSALDFGITRSDGSNRALTQGEFDWVHTLGVRRGIQWTGRYFNPVEQWHHNGGYAATVPAIKGVIRPGEPLPKPAAPSTSPEEDDNMPAAVNYAYCILDGSKFQNALYAIDATTGNVRHVLEIEERAIARGRALSVADWRKKYAEAINGPQVQALINAAGGEQKPGYLGKVKEA